MPGMMDTILTRAYFRGGEGPRRVPGGAIRARLPAPFLRCPDIVPTSRGTIRGNLTESAGGRTQSDADLTRQTSRVVEQYRPRQ